jgi:hypothetical protein
MEVKTNYYERFDLRNYLVDMFNINDYSTDKRNMCICIWLIEHVKSFSCIRHDNVWITPNIHIKCGSGSLLVLKNEII